MIFMIWIRHILKLKMLKQEKTASGISWKLKKKPFDFFLSQDYNTKQQVVSGGRAYDFNFPTESSDLQNWIDRPKANQDQLKKIGDSSRKSRQKRSSRKSRHNDRYSVSSVPTRRRRGSERIRAPPLPQQQQQHPPAEYEDQFWKMRQESRLGQFPRECRNYKFGPLSEYGKENSDNYIRFTTVSN